MMKERGIVLFPGADTALYELKKLLYNDLEMSKPKKFESLL